MVHWICFGTVVVVVLVMVVVGAGYGAYYCGGGKASCGCFGDPGVM